MYENLTRKSIIAIVFLVFSSQLCILSYDLGNDYSMELENLLQFRKHACHKPTKVLMSRFLIENVSQIVVFVLYFLFFFLQGELNRGSSMFWRVCHSLDRHNQRYNPPIDSYRKYASF